MEGIVDEMNLCKIGHRLAGVGCWTTFESGPSAPWNAGMK